MLQMRIFHLESDGRKSQRTPSFLSVKTAGFRVVFGQSNELAKIDLACLVTYLSEIEVKEKGRKRM